MNTQGYINIFVDMFCFVFCIKTPDSRFTKTTHNVKVMGTSIRVKSLVVTKTQMKLESNHFKKIQTFQRTFFSCPSTKKLYFHEEQIQTPLKKDTDS